MIKATIAIAMTAIGLATGMYQKPATVQEATHTHIVYKTPDGNEWECLGNYGKEKVGRKVLITFSDNGTKNIYDDIIMDVELN